MPESYSIVPSNDIDAIRAQRDSLKSRATRTYDFFDDSIIYVHVILTAIVVTFTAIVTKSWAETIVVLIFYGYVPGFIVSMILTVVLSMFFGKRVDNYRNTRRINSEWYQRYEFLQEEIERFDEERLRPTRQFLKASEVEIDDLRKSLAEIEYDLKYKRKWYDEYRILEERVNDALERLPALTGDLRALIENVPHLPADLSRELRSAKEDANHLILKGRFLTWKFQGLKNWTPPVRTYSPSRQDIDIQKTLRHSSQARDSESDGKTKRVEANDRAGKLKGNTTQGFTEYREPKVVEPPPPPEPTKAIEHKSFRKIPFEEYAGAAAAKASVGDLGELLVMHFERSRVEHETGRSPDGKVRRVSDDSDAFGYDIESIFEGRKVYIEVKTTTAGFWKDFFLTSNEGRKMQELGDDYWLYRVHELSRVDGSANLSVFRGQAAIEEYFVLEPAAFIFRKRPVD